VADIIRLSWKTPSLFLFPLGALPSVLYTFSSGTRRSALLTDILSLSFSHNALSLLKIDTFRTGCILLSGLFVYDIWWVFGTEVVSKNSSSPPSAGDMLFLFFFFPIFFFFFRPRAKSR
jgi:minor histocompatibility antigen H13